MLPVPPHLPSSLAILQGRPQQDPAAAACRTGAEPAWSYSPWKSGFTLSLCSFLHFNELCCSIGGFRWSQNGGAASFHTAHRDVQLHGEGFSKTGKGAALAIFQTRFPATEDDSIKSQKAPAVFTHFVSQADTAPASCVSGKGAAGAALPRGELQLMKVPNYTR